MIPIPEAFVMQAREHGQAANEHSGARIVAAFPCFTNKKHL